jgi:site-specific recombinase XerC
MLWQLPNAGTLKGKRDRAILAVLLGCGLRRRELAELAVDYLQRREGHWVIVDLIGKGGHIRTVPVPDWVKCAIDEWVNAAGVRGKYGNGCRFSCLGGRRQAVGWH